MYGYVLCRCGRCLANVYDLFKRLRADKIAAQVDGEISPKFLPLSDAATVELGDILDQLQLTRECCRACIMQQVEFKEVY